MRVSVEFDGKTVTFDPTRLSLQEPASIEQLAQATLSNDGSLVAELTGWIATGLKKEGKSMKIKWQAKMQEGQEVFPSQEYLRDEKKKDAPSRVYAKLPSVSDSRILNQASMHSQKIGAALRHIDIWHGNDKHNAVAINPYAGIQETGAVLRVEKARGGLDSAASFYALRNKPEDLLDDIAKAETAEQISGNVHFVVANLVRGGVFGQKGDE